MNPIYTSVTELSDLLNEKKLSSQELTQAFIDRTQNLDNKVNAFLSFDPKDALAQAQQSDERRAKGKSQGPLDGIPVGIKDVIAEKGKPLTCASKMLEKFIAPYDATTTLALKNAGAITWGRLNMDEFAMGSSTENSSFTPTSNPWNLECIPGGSSGGSAACVSAGEAPIALGSDTGGSIRQPAALCGIVGLKPTYGLISRYGLVAFASSLDQIGPMGLTVEDTAMLLQEIAGHDVNDSTSVKVDIPDYRKALQESNGPWTIGIPKEYFSSGLDDSVRIPVEKAIDYYKSIGCTLKEISLPHSELAISVYYIIATAEASSNLARYDGIRYTYRAEDAKSHIDVYFKSRGEAFGQEVKRRIILGTYVLSTGYYDAYYLKAQKARTLIRDDFTQAFKEVDAIIAPTTPTTAFKRGEKTNDPLKMYLSDIYTISLNLAGLPGISLPCGFSNGLPVGLQLIGKPFKEAELLSIAHRFERDHEFYKQHPNL